MADPLTIAVSCVTAFGAVQLAPLVKLPLQRRKRRVDGDKVVAETKNLEAHTMALLLRPYELAVAQAEKNAENALAEAGDAKADAARANRRNDRLERRYAEIEQFLEGPMASWGRARIHQIHEYGGDAPPPPKFVHQES